MTERLREPGSPDDQGVYDAFLGSGATRWGWWLDEEAVDEPGWRFCGVLWGGDHRDDLADWRDYQDDESNPSFEFDLGPEEILAALEFVAALDQGDQARAHGVGPGLLFEARKWVAGEWADCDFDSDLADQVLQIAVQLANGEKRPVVLYA